MSENKLRMFNKQTPPLTGKKRLQPIVLSDSKGRYIEKFYRDSTEKQLIIISQSGLKAEESKQWLKRNILVDRKIIKHVFKEIIEIIETIPRIKTNIP
jgi:hypothetical protein